MKIKFDGARGELNMKCTFCHKQINIVREKYELFGMDGDFIHKDCKPKIKEEMDKVANMSDSEFYNWMTND